MSPWRDVVDWVGGYPFEVARPEQVVDFCRGRGFELRNLKTCGGGHGCNEFVFNETAALGRVARPSGDPRIGGGIAPPRRPMRRPASAAHASSCRSSKTCGRPSGTRPAASPTPNRQPASAGTRAGHTDDHLHDADNC